MERMVPLAAEQPMVRGGSGLATLRGLTYTLLACALAAGVWTRFNPEIASIFPSLASPVAGAAESRGLVELALVPTGQNEAAVAEMGLPASDAARLIAALRHGDLRLARMPLMDAGIGAEAGHTVRLRAGGYTTTVPLGRAPVSVTLPIGPVGEVAFETSNTDGVDIGTLSLNGPVRLPSLHPGDTLEVGVIAQ